MSLTIKAYLYKRWNGEPAEIRRFSVDQDVSTSYTYLTEKIAQVFPSLQPNSIVVAWIDADGDRITISSDEELVEALDQFDGNVFRLHIKKRDGDQPHQPASGEQPSMETGEKAEGEESSSSGQDQSPPFHPGVICDGCNGPVYGIRFKCLMCPDYDLCSSCEGQGIHAGHSMVTIETPHAHSPWGFLHPHHQHWRRHGGCPWRGGFGPRGGRCGPRGRGCGPKGGHHAGGWAQWMDPNFWQRGPGNGCQGRTGCGRGGSMPQWWQPRPQKPADQSEHPMETETPKGKEEAATDQEQARLQEEQRKSFLQGIGEAVSSFLEPFGVKVDVGVAGDSQPPPEEGTPAAADPSHVPSGASYTLDPASNAPPSGATPQASPGSGVEEAVAQLRTMGFDDEGGWLTELARAKGGDIGKILDALHPGQSS